MKKITTLLLLALLALNTQAIIAANDKSDAQASFEEAVREYNFENNSRFINDEKIEEEAVENKANFWSKVRNSSHFSSDTATKTYIPINKIQD